MSIRASLFALLFIVGCGGSSDSGDAALDVDLGTGQSCFAVAECAFQCTAGDGTCVEKCVANGSMTAQQAYAALTTCGYQLCTGSDGGVASVDGGLTTCTSETDQSPACVQCVQNQVQTPSCAAFATSCANQ